MSTDSKLEALRTGLEMAQELLAIKREALGDDYRLTRTYWEAERELQAALAEAEQEQAGEAVARPLEPLTQTKLIALWADKSDGPSNAEIVSFARAIERAHGITKDTK